MGETTLHTRVTQVHEYPRGTSEVHTVTSLPKEVRSTQRDVAFQAHSQSRCALLRRQKQSRHMACTKIVTLQGCRHLRRKVLRLAPYYEPTEGQEAFTSHSILKFPLRATNLSRLCPQFLEWCILTSISGGATGTSGTALSCCCASGPVLQAWIDDIV